MTSREVLRFYGQIRGISDAQIERMVSYLIDRLSLTEYADRPCGTYSGGNKRKLSVAIALIGNPPVVFLSVLFGRQACHAHACRRRCSCAGYAYHAHTLPRSCRFAVPSLQRRAFHRNGPRLATIHVVSGCDCASGISKHCCCSG